MCQHQLVLEAPNPVLATVDPSRIDQALANLVSNALKYSLASRLWSSMGERSGSRAISNAPGSGTRSFAAPRRSSKRTALCRHCLCACGWTKNNMGEENFLPH